MANSEFVPGTQIRHTAKVGKVVRLNGYIVPETVVTTITGAEPIDGREAIEGRKWPDMTFTFTVRDGVAMCADFRMTSKLGDRPIRNQDLQLINLDALAVLAFEAHAGTQVAPGHYQNRTEPDAESSRQIRRKVDASYSEPLSELKQVALIYCDPANRLTPANNVYETMNYGSKETANRRIRKAREKGLIPPVGATDAELDEQHKVLTNDLEETK